MRDGTHVVVDIKHMQATQAVHHRLQVLEDAVAVLTESFHLRQNMYPVSDDAKEQSEAHCFGPADNSPCLQMKVSGLLILNV